MENIRAPFATTRLPLPPSHTHDGIYVGDRILPQDTDTSSGRQVDRGEKRKDTAAHWLLNPDPTADTHAKGARGAGKTTYKSDDGNRNTGTPVLHQIMLCGTKLFRGDEGSSE